MVLISFGSRTVMLILVALVCCGIAAIIRYIYKIIRLAAGLKQLKHKVVFITGASSGLGRQLAKEYYLAGCKIIVAARSVDKLKELCRELVELRNEQVNSLYEPVPHRLDIADVVNLPRELAAIVAIHGRIDVLINNAGVSYRGEIANTVIDVHQNLMNVNYFGHVAITQFLLPLFRAQRGGDIVCISSVQDRIAIPFRSAYTASKHAFLAYFDSLRAEETQSGIRVLVVSPGYIATNLSVNALTGSGESYGKMDETTRTGILPSVVAEKVLHAHVKGQKELLLADWKTCFAIVLRCIVPGLYFWIMARRAKRHYLATMKEE